MHGSAPPGAHSQSSVPKKRREFAWGRISGDVGTREMLGVVLEEAGTEVQHILYT